MATPESSSASMRLGLRVWSLPSTGCSFTALAVETGSAKMGTWQFSASQAMLSAGDVGVDHHQPGLLDSSFCRLAEQLGRQVAVDVHVADTASAMSPFSSLMKR